MKARAAAGGVGDAVDVERQLSALVTRLGAAPRFFSLELPLWIARAPGRLDLMGGFGDYSGSLVLELPLAVATWVVAQEHSAPELVLVSEGAPAVGGEATVTIPLDQVVPATGTPLEYAAARALLTGRPRAAWAAYAAGALVVLHRERARPLRRGLKVLVHSQVPAGKGISSSAALEVASLNLFSALATADAGGESTDVIDERALGLLAQKVENLIVGAPCGVMDQLTAAAGRRDHLIEILCQPGEILGHRALPPGLEVFAIDSGIRHQISGADYGSVRAAAFMGYRMVAAHAGLTARAAAAGRVAIDDPVFGGYLANVGPTAWRARFRDAVPEVCSGRDFLARHQGITDAATDVAPDRTYAVRACTEYPIDEHARVCRFRDLLATGAADDETRLALGALMFESHAGYSACGLGSDGTDHLVALVRSAGPGAGLYGAKITGGGSGGSIAVLARAGARAAIDDIASRYRAATGHETEVFAGSSDGAHAFGIRRVVPTW